MKNHVYGKLKSYYEIKSSLLKLHQNRKTTLFAALDEVGGSVVLGKVRLCL